MFALFAPVWRAARALRVARPAVVGAAGWIGIVAARHNALHAPVVVGVALGVGAIALGLRERGAGLAALGVAATAAFSAPPGLGPLLVATGVVLAASPASADARLVEWSDVIEALIALPALAGLATTVAAEPSQRGVVVGSAAGLLVVASWLRPPGRPTRPALASFVGLAAGAALAGAPQLWDRLGQLPAATVTAGRGIVGGFAVFAVVVLTQSLRPARTSTQVRARHAVRRSPRRVSR